MYNSQKNYSIEEIREHNRQIRKVLKKSTYYTILLKRRYKSIAGYPTWESVALDLTCFMEVKETGLWEELDQSCKLLVIMGHITALENPPVYWINKDLMTSLLNTDIPEDTVLADLKPVLPFLYFMLPKGFIKTEEGAELNWVGVRFIEKSNETVSYPLVNGGYVHSVKVEQERLAWVSCSSLMVGYSSTEAIPLATESINKFSSYAADANASSAGIFNENDSKLTNTISKLVINLLLLMQYKPNFITDDTEVSYKGVGFTKGKKRENLINPRWIGKDFLVKKVKNKSISTTSRPRESSVYPYWVRGHWRRVVTGKLSEGKRKLKMIYPYLVIGDR